MSLRVKLILTYVIMLVITVFIVITFGIAILTHTMGLVVNSFIGDQTEESALNRVVDVIVDVRYTEKYDPDTLVKDSFAEKLASQIEMFSGFLVIRNNEQFKAFGQPNADVTLYKKIVESKKDTNPVKHDLLFSDRFDWMRQEYFFLEYNFNNSSHLSYYFVFKIDHSKIMAGRLNNLIFIILLLLAAIIILPLLWIVTKDIVIPLKKLDRCAQEIAKGNLDFQLNSNSQNEIGSVTRSYEKMRFELKKSIASQLQMEESRKQLLSDITHDLKTPITSIKGYIQGIRDGVANDPEKVSKYLDVIYTKTVDMNAMIDDLFLFSKLDSGKEPFNKDYIDITQFYNNCQRELQLELDGRAVELKAHCRVSPGFKVLMDSQKIKRVIQNIVSNSLKFMEKERKLINLTFEEDNEGLIVKIKDNGIGIDINELDKIFDRFYRTDPSRNRNTGGSGLGLAITKQIIDRHNGTIQADSVKGEWTEITFKIPQGK